VNILTWNKKMMTFGMMQRPCYEQTQDQEQEIKQTLKHTRVPLSGIKLDLENNKIQYSTEVVKTEAFSYIPADSVKTKKMSDENMNTLKELIEGSRWARRPVANNEGLVEIPTPHGSDYRLEDEHILDYFAAHVRGPNSGNVVSQFDTLWTKIYNIVDGDE